MTIIQTHALTKTYGKGDIEVRALDGVDVQINENEFVAIMGPSGSGKSTLMNILGCLDRPTSGQYILAGEAVSGLDKAQLAHIRSKRLGFIFQAYNLLARTTALENVLLPLLYSRNGTHTDAEKRQIALDALASVGLSDRAHHQPHELSGGQQQRVAIARALINDPVLILADEPTGNLDTRSSHDIMNLLHDLHDRGRTIVMVTHENDIAAHASRVIHFRDGKIDADVQNGHRAEDGRPKTEDGGWETEDKAPPSSVSRHLPSQR
ncbi:MAG: ABC transporter ATP-binding protein [Anaerolineales bacterium]|nr:ABC transporter ATP-binding protein [Anaerolineales bacterium]